MKKRKKARVKHKHRCTKCKLIWEHDERSAGVNPYHNCPNCNKEQYFKYLGLHKAEEFWGIE